MLKKLLLTLSIFSAAQAMNTPLNTPKRTLNANYTLNYLKTPKPTNNFLDIFNEGSFYGRLRNNNFSYSWSLQDNKHGDHFISGVGGSLEFKTAPYKKVSFSTSFNYTRGIFNENDLSVLLLKSGNDALSRYDYLNEGKKDIAVFAQLYVDYEPIKDTHIILGRQIIESFFAKSNDSKMIPNTFDGLVLDSKIDDNLNIKLAYLAKQKLRDHSKMHSILAYGDINSPNPTDIFKYNDDSVMHRGLTHTRLDKAGVSSSAPLILLDSTYRPIDTLKLNLSAYNVPSLLTSVMGEVKYKIYENENLSITPGFRYIHQFDNGAGAIGGASLKGTLAGKTGAQFGYKDAQSLDSDMIGARLVSVYKNIRLNLAYTHIFDEADLVAPWRGFPTSGYTRSMAIYNWRANMSSYRAELKFNLDQNGIYEDTYVQTSVLYIDGDQDKSQSDAMYYYLGFIQNIPSYNNLSLRLRFGYKDAVLGDFSFSDITDPLSDKAFDSLDTRFEINYLF